MGMIIAIILCLIAAVVLPYLITKSSGRTEWDGEEKTTVVPSTAKLANSVIRYGAIALAIGLILGTSYVTVGDNEIAQMKRIYMASDLPSGRIIGLGSQKGKKAETIGPGFHFIFGLNVLNDVEKVPMITIPPGAYATLSARDGRPLPPGVTYAPSFQRELLTYLDAETFLTTEEDNVGFKGPQATVLLPGTWRVNTYLWDVSKPRKLTDIPKGFVGVIKANTKTSVNFGSAMSVVLPEKCSPVEIEGRLEDALSSPLVPVGCVGIWDKVLPPGQYYVNTDVFNVTTLDTRVQAWEYKGGYLSRMVDLTVDAGGEIEQNAREEQVDMPATAVDEAIGIKIDGYTIHQSVRVLVQVTPRNAPFIVASVGGMEEVENRIISPAVQSAVRDLSGQFITVTEAVFDDKTGKPKLDENGDAITRQSTRPISPLDLIERREILQALAERKIKPEGDKAGVTIKEVRFLQPDMPPEVLIPRKRRQLAYEMIETLQREQEAQQERIAKENAKATADQQGVLVEAEINVQRALQYEQERDARGRADRKYLEQVAKGQEAQANVLGNELVAKLKMMELILANPEALEHLGKVVPNTVVISGGGGGGVPDFGSLEAMAAVFTGSGVLSNQTGTGTTTPVLPRKTALQQ